MTATLTGLLPRVHVVTSDEILADPDFLARASEVMHTLGERGAVHLRGSRTTGAELHALAQSLLELQTRTGCWLVINNRVDVALSTHAGAIQLTSKSLPVSDVRALLPDARIGASVHSDAEARAAAAQGADWLVAGNVFTTRSHPGAPAKGAEFLSGIVATGLPVIAIGGIRAEDVVELRNAGAYGVAMIRGIWATNNAEAAATRYLSIYDALGNA